ncbi:MAG: AraC family transcriptional regulator [Desulfobacter sp.]|nr:MAG: AraC family transcriptional regulator [Desulfobacter sp.]
MKNQNPRIKQFHLPFIHGVTVLYGRQIDNVFRRHVHQSYIFGIVDEGKRIISHAGGIARVSERDVFILNPNQMHACRSGEEGSHSYRILSVSEDAMGAIASQISERGEPAPFFKPICCDDEKLSARMRRMFEMLEMPGWDIRIETQVYSCLYYLVLNFSQQPPRVHAPGEQKESIKRACDYIHQHYDGNPSLKEMAGIACLSPFHFQREFKKTVGITPQEYLTGLKIRESRKLLERQRIVDVACRLGFFDQSHFSRIFKKTVGVSPGKYQKTNALK